MSTNYGNYGYKLDTYLSFSTAPDPGPNDGRDMTLSGEWWTLKHGAQPPNLEEFAGGMSLA